MSIRDEDIFSGKSLDDAERRRYFEELESTGAKLHFNGLNGTTGRYLVEPMTAAEIVERVGGGAPPGNLAELRHKVQLVSYPVQPGNDPARLDQAGWAVIFAADASHAVRDALEPLLALRREQAGARFKVFEGKRGYQKGDTKETFCERNDIAQGPADPERLGYYVLLVGGPGSIPFAFQQQLDVMRGVGRLDFDTPEEYASYAASVVTVEKGKVKLKRRAAFFGVANPDDAATRLSEQHLVRGLKERLARNTPFKRWIDEGETRRQAKIQWDLDAHLGPAATKAKLAELLGGGATPALLFTASHGMGFNSDDPRQLPHQGALLCQDWPGEIQWGPQRIPHDFYFAAEDVADDARLLGLICVTFACFSGGTPKLDEFSEQARPGSKDRRPIAPHDFTARLPRRLLGHPKGGALAVIAHVERAWGYSFLSPSLRAQTGLFEGAVKELLTGQRVGWTTEGLNLKYAELATDLSRVLEERKYDPSFINNYDLAARWTANNDARGYVLLGDPAVRLPFADDGVEAEERPVLEVRARPLAPLTPEAASRGVEGSTFAAAPGDAAVPFGLGSSVVGTLQRAVQGLAEKVAAGVSDLSSLTVTTYTSPTPETFRFNERDGASGGQLRALTHVAFDGDIVQCVPDKAGAIDKDLWTIHLETVKLAQQNRTEFMKAIAEITGKLFGALKP
ncbi:C25 family cysteine peptidase [Sorangium sp. So ce388]|uniref:C25 family cysteine peptidase n=1 Tax=Sorangium sp. So ce388 TaxID=3133309 RepID=UPI003F5BF1F1